MTNQESPQRIRIPVKEVKQRYDEGDITVLDVVDRESYNKYPYRVKNAIRINPEDIPDEYGSIPKDRPVYAY